MSDQLMVQISAAEAATIDPGRAGEPCLSRLHE